MVLTPSETGSEVRSSGGCAELVRQQSPGTEAARGSFARGERFRRPCWREPLFPKRGQNRDCTCRVDVERAWAWLSGLRP